MILLIEMIHYENLLLHALDIVNNFSPTTIQAVSVMNLMSQLLVLPLRDENVSFFIHLYNHVPNLIYFSICFGRHLL